MVGRSKWEGDDAYPLEINFSTFFPHPVLKFSMEKKEEKHNIFKEVFLQFYEPSHNLVWEMRS